MTTSRSDVLAAAQGTPEPFQARVALWMDATFGPEISADRQERAHRFLEEALELVQSTGTTESEARQLVAYVFGRPAGGPHQEVGGVEVTLAAFCLAHGLDKQEAGETELARVWTKVEQIRAKQAAKPKHSPLPEHPAPAPQDTAEAMAEVERLKAQLVAAEDEIARLEDEVGELRDTPWPKWAKRCLKIVRSHSGHDGYDDAIDGVDLPQELKEALEEYENQVEREKTARVAAEAEVVRLDALASLRAGREVPGELVALSEKATGGPWRARSTRLSRDHFCEIDGEGWSELASVTTQMEDEHLPNEEGISNLKLIVAAVNFIRTLISAQKDCADGGKL